MNQQSFYVIMIIFIVTITFRLLPFLAVETFRESNYLSYLGKVMPVGVTTLLVAYSLMEVDFTRWPYGLPEVLIGAGAGFLYWLTRNSLASIGAGLVAYVFLRSYVL